MKAKDFILELQKLDPETDLYSSEGERYTYISKYPPIYEMWIKKGDLNPDFGKIIPVENNPTNEFDTKIIVIG